MVQEFLEVDNLDTFRIVAAQSPIIIRRDPYLFAQYFAAMIFINLADLEEREVKRLFEMLRGKMIVVKSLVRASTISEFIDKEEKQELKPVK